MDSEYFDTSARFTSATNRINDRLKTLADRLGTESKVYKDMVNQIYVNIPESNLRYNKDGVIQISKPASLYKDTDIHEAVDKMDKGGIETWGEYRSQYEESYERAKQQTGETDLSIEDFINVEESLPSAISSLYDKAGSEENRKKAESILNKSHKTYEELSEVVKLMGG